MKVVECILCCFIVVSCTSMSKNSKERTNDNTDLDYCKNDSLIFNDFYLDLINNPNLISNLNDTCVLNIFNCIKNTAIIEVDDSKCYDLIYAIAKVSDGWISDAESSIITELFFEDLQGMISFYEQKADIFSSQFHRFLMEGLCVYIFDSNNPNANKSFILSKIDGISEVHQNTKSQLKMSLNEINESFCD